MEERQPEVPDQYEQTWEKAVRWRRRTPFCSAGLRSNLFKSKVMKKLIIFNEELAIHRTKKDFQRSSEETTVLTDACNSSFMSKHCMKHFGEVTKVPIDALKDYVNFNVLFQCNTVGFEF